MKLCVVGGGPAAAYFIREALKRVPGAHIVVLEKSQNLLGHLSSSVAPDQKAIRRTINHLRNIFTDPRVQLFKGIEIGRGLDLSSIQRHYDAVIMCIGAEERKLDIPGSEHIISAGELMKNINGVYNNKLPYLKGEVAIVGSGNVSLDAARMVLHPNKDSLSEYLRRTSVGKVTIIGRSSPKNTAFSSSVLAETVQHPLTISCSDKAKEYLAFNTKDRRSALLLDRIKDQKNPQPKMQPQPQPQAEQRKEDGSLKKKLDLVFWETAQRVLKKGDKYIIETKDSENVVHRRIVDHVLSAIGYVSPNISSLIKNVSIPVYAIGWARTNGKGNLSDALISAVSAADKLIPGTQTI